MQTDRHPAKAYSATILPHKKIFVFIWVNLRFAFLLFITNGYDGIRRCFRRKRMVTANPVTPGKDSNCIKYQRFMSGVFPGAYIRAGGWGTNLYHWYPPVVRARVILYTRPVFLQNYLFRLYESCIGLEIFEKEPRMDTNGHEVIFRRKLMSIRARHLPEELNQGKPNEKHYGKRYWEQGEMGCSSCNLSWLTAAAPQPPPI